ncbi:integrase, catalytic region, zinc finger, CCHC-type containing protein [Tanacetum coccineum]
MAFLTDVASSRFPTTNNQLRISSNPRNQVTIQDGRVIVQQVQGRQWQNYSGTTYKNNATCSRGNNTTGQARVVKCYNCQGEGHMARQCTQPKRLRNASTEDLDTYNSDSDDLSNAQAVLMDNISTMVLMLSQRSEVFLLNIADQPQAIKDDRISQKPELEQEE